MLSICAESATLFRSEGFDYIALHPGGECVVKIYNNHGTKCHVELYIEGKHIDRFAVYPRQTIKIKRSIGGRASQFAYVKSKSVSNYAGLKQNKLYAVHEERTLLLLACRRMMKCVR